MSIVLVLLFPALGFAGAGLLAHNIWRKETQDRATTFNGPLASDFTVEELIAEELVSA